MTADLSGIVRSIRVATALNERVAILIRPIEYQTPEQLSNVLGELRQLYPEVWSHLDDARSQLAAHGKDVAAYTALRARPAASAGGVLQVDVQDGLGDLHKSAHLNHEGHRLATEAIYVLRAALPQVDWIGLEQAEAAELAAFGSLGPAVWKKVLFGTIMLGIVGTAIALYVYLRIAG